LHCASRGEYKNAKIKTIGGSKTTDATRWQKFAWSIQYTHTGECLLEVTTWADLTLFKRQFGQFQKQQDCYAIANVPRLFTFK